MYFLSTYCCNYLVRLMCRCTCFRRYTQYIAGHYCNCYTSQDILKHDTITIQSSEVCHFTDVGMFYYGTSFISPWFQDLPWHTSSASE